MEKFESPQKSNPLLENILAAVEQDPIMKSTQDQLVSLLNSDHLDREKVEACLHEYEETYLSIKELEPPFTQLPPIQTKQGELFRLWSTKGKALKFVFH